MSIYFHIVVEIIRFYGVAPAELEQFFRRFVFVKKWVMSRIGCLRYFSLV